MLIASGSLSTIAILVENKSAGMVMSKQQFRACILSKSWREGGKDEKDRQTDRQTERDRNGLLKHQNLTPVSHLLQKGHTLTILPKAVPLTSGQTFKYMSLWWGYSLPNHHRYAYRDMKKNLKNMEYRPTIQIIPILFASIAIQERLKDGHIHDILSLYNTGNI